VEPEPIIVEEQRQTATPDWSVIERLTKPVEGIKSAISRMEDEDSPAAKALKSMTESFANVQENLSLLINKHSLSTADGDNIDAVIESFSNLENRISTVKKEIVDKSKMDSNFAALNASLTELRCCIVAVKESPSAYLKDLEESLEHVQDAFETVLSAQRGKTFSEISTKVSNAISDIDKSIESIDRKLEQHESVVEIHIECQALAMLAKPLQSINKCVTQIQEKPNTADLMIDALQNLDKSIAIIREQSADKPLTEPPHTNLGPAIGLSKILIPCLYELQESVEATKTLWREETVLEGLIILEKPICKLQTMMNMLCDQFLLEEAIWTIDAAPKKKSVKKKLKEPEIEASVKKADKTDNIVKKEETIPAKDEDVSAIISDVISDVKDKENKKKLLEKTEEEEQQKKDEKSIKKMESQKDDESRKEKEEAKKAAEHQKQKEEIIQIKSNEEVVKKEEPIKKPQKVNEQTDRKERTQEIKQIEENIQDKKIKKDNMV